MKKEYEIKFYIFGHPFKTTVLAENEAAAQDQLTHFIRSNTQVVSNQVKNSKRNNAVDFFNIFDSFKK
jgi:hypothetical protein